MIKRVKLCFGVTGHAVEKGLDVRSGVRAGAHNLLKYNSVSPMTDCQWIAAMSNAFGQVDQFSLPFAK